jgi:hypothetical protein
MIGSLARSADPSTAQTMHNDILRDLEMEHADEPPMRTIQKFGQRLGLWEGAGEPIENESKPRVLTGEPFLHHGIRHRIRDEFATIHIGFGQHAQRSVPLDVIAEEISSRYVR